MKAIVHRGNFTKPSCAHKKALESFSKCISFFFPNYPYEVNQTERLQLAQDLGQRTSGQSEDSNLNLLIAGLILYANLYTTLIHIPINVTSYYSAASLPSPLFRILSGLITVVKRKRLGFWVDYACLFWMYQTRTNVGLAMEN